MQDPRDPHPSGLVPSVVGYEIGSRLGEGSFGTVYRARQQSTGQDVAIKFLRPLAGERRSMGATGSDRFRREMRLGAELWHPHIVRLLDSGVLDDGLPYAVFEYVPGMTLRQLLDTERKLGITETLGLMTEVLDALACAHAQSVVHRDLKPENIMITKTGVRRHAMVLDFGLGGFVAESERAAAERLTGAYELIGTPCYAAPEQLRGEHVTAHSDLYSCGLILLECLSGEIAMHGASGHDVILKQLSDDPVPIPEWLRGHPLGRVLEAMTAKAPERRTLTIPTILATFERLLGDVEPPNVVPGAPAERRQVTVVSCRISVVRRDGAPVDVEQVDAELRAVHALCTKSAAASGAVTANVFADRSVLVFGVPTAREEDARRAVGMVLELMDAVRRREAAPDADRALRSEISTGIHSGLVIAREDEWGLHRVPVLGYAPRVAEMLDELAARGEVLLSEDTGRLLRGSVRTSRVDTLHLDDGRALAVLRLESLDASPHAEPGTWTTDVPLVGRDRLLEQLQAAWSDAGAGSAGALLLTGEPGIGKSRLVRELRHLVPEGAWLEARCLVEHADIPLHPIAELLRSVPDSLEALFVRHGFDVDTTLPILLDVLEPADEDAATLDASPQRRRDVALRTLVALFLRMAEERPLVFVLEDLQWADPTTLELATRLVSAIRAPAREGRAGALLLLFTGRPDFIPPWSIDEVTLLPLGRLEPTHVLTLTTAVLGSGRSASDSLLAEIARRADGIPLFVEEITHALAERNPMVAGDDQYLGTPIPDTIPTSLRDLLRARIDRLSSTGREVVQLAAVLGREFRYELLASAVGKDDLKLRHTLREVCATGMLLQRWDATSETFVFKHALVREAAYDSITRPARAGLHRTVASMLRTRFADVEGRQLEILAWHLEGAGDALAAASYWQRAAHRALGRGAHVEAERLLRRALALLRALPETPARLRAETDVLSSLGTVLFSTHGYGAREGEAVFREAQALLGRLGDDVSLGVVSGLAILRFTRSDRTGAAELLPLLEHLAARTDDLVAQITGQALLGVHAFWAGELRSAHEKLTRAIELYDKPEFQRFARAYGHDGGLFCHAYDVLALWLMGDASRARALEHGMSEIAARSGNPFSRALALGYGACLAYDLGDGDGLLRRADELATLSTREHLYLWLAIAMCAHAWALHLRGAFDEAAAEMRAGLNTLRGLGVRSSYAFFLPPLGAALRDAGRTSEGLTVIDSALAAAPRLLSQVHVPELHRIRGELLDLTGDKDGAEQALRTALAMAAAQGALAYQLRAATSLACLLRGTERRAEAGTILSAVYGSFTEPRDTVDLRRAATVLDSVR